MTVEGGMLHAAAVHADSCGAPVQQLQLCMHQPAWRLSNHDEYAVLQVFTADVESAIKADAESHHGIFLGTRKDLPAVTAGQKSSEGSSSGASQHQWPGGHGLHVC